MMWRDEVLEGIRDSSKFVAFIDEDYLMSFNCIAELQAAISMNKIIVPVVLDDYVSFLGLSACCSAALRFHGGRQ